MDCSLRRPFEAPSKGWGSRNANDRSFSPTRRFFTDSSLVDFSLVDGLHYRFGPHALTLPQAEGFFVGWPTPPSSGVLLELLSQSDEALIALEDGRIVGYVTALTDRILFSSITSLEVLPEYQSHGIGTELMRRMLERLSGVYATDLVCDANLVPFYESVGMRRLDGMGVRRYELQAGAL